MRLSSTLVFALLAAASARAEASELLVSGRGDPIRLRLEILVDGKPADAAWEAFLDRLFDYFDRDGDGALTAEEAARVFPLPLPGGREVPMDFARLDANRDGKGSRAEFKAFYRQAGFTPIVVQILPPPVEVSRLGAALFHHLDRDGDGKLSRKELLTAPELLQRLDENEDEVLTPGELLAGFGGKGLPTVRNDAIRLCEPDAKSPPAAVLRLFLVRGQATGRVTAVRKKTVAELPPRHKGEPLRLQVGDGVWVADEVGVPKTGLAPTRAFLLAQFDNLRGEAASVTRKQLEEDDSAQVLAALFQYADRNGDGKLTRAEVDGFLALVAQGTECQAVVTITDRGRSLFDVLDRDRDGRLDLRELKRAAELLSDDRAFLMAADVPRQVTFGVTRGLGSRSFGPVPLAAVSRGTVTLSKPTARGPAWFRAMDRNGDGFVSPGEFLGPPEVFRRLDLDGDGLISVAEAEQAERQPAISTKP